jgi:hypothetical protein
LTSHDSRLALLPREGRDTWNQGLRVVRMKVRMTEQQSQQAVRSLCDQLQITEAELQTRLAFLSFGEQYVRNLVEIRDLISSHVDEINGEL